MRARYYEATAGRFISEDPRCDGVNWFSYCYSNPLNHVDQDGCAEPYNYWWGLGIGIGCFILAALSFRLGNRLDGKVQAAAGALLAASISGFALALGETKEFGGSLWALLVGGGGALAGLFGVVVGATKWGARLGGVGGIAILAAAMYDCILIAALAGTIADGDIPSGG